MSLSFLDPKTLPVTTGLQDLIDVTPPGKIRIVKVRFANVGAADAYGNLVITNGVTSIQRAKNYPVPYQQSGSAPDMEEPIELPPGWKIQAMASANGVVEASATNLKEADLSDFS